MSERSVHLSKLQRSDCVHACCFNGSRIFNTLARGFFPFFFPADYRYAFDKHNTSRSAENHARARLFVNQHAQPCNPHSRAQRERGKKKSIDRSRSSFAYMRRMPAAFLRRVIGCSFLLLRTYALCKSIRTGLNGGLFCWTRPMKGAAFWREK